MDAVVCGDEMPQGRPAPYLIFRCMEATGAVSVGRVANVGDTALDLRAGVLSGAHNRNVLAAEPHTHLFASVADLPTLLADALPGAAPDGGSMTGFRNT